MARKSSNGWRLHVDVADKLVWVVAILTEISDDDVQYDKRFILEYRATKSELRP